LSINSPATNGANDPLTINLNPKANYELVLNLLNAETASSTGTLLSAQA
jgi:hypothetical protein